MNLYQPNTKVQGAIGLNAAMLYYSALGWICHISPGDASKIDLIIEKDGEIKRVQVKTTTHINSMMKSRTFSLNLDTVGGNWTQSSKTVKKIQDSPFDLLFILTGDWDIFEFSKEELGERNILTLPTISSVRNFRCRLFTSDHRTVEESMEVKKKRKWSAYPRREKFTISKEDLLVLLENLQYNFVEAGKQLGVSDNAVRKRAKKYGIEYKSRQLRKDRGINIYK